MNISDARAERQRRANRYKMVQAELARQKKEEEFDLMRKRKQKAAEIDEALAHELSEQQRRELKDEKMLQLVMEFPEVRNLQKAINNAYANKDRGEFRSMKPLLKANEAAERREYLEKCVEQDRRDLEEDERKRKEALERFKKHQEAQLKIIRDQRERALTSIEDQKQERIAVDAVVARLQERDMLDALARREAHRKQEEEHAAFMRLRNALKQAEKDRMKKEEEAIVAYLAEQERRKEVEKKRMQERDIAKARILEEQCRKISEEQAKKLELEHILQEYYQEERLAKERALIKAEKESYERLCADVAKENFELIQARKKQREEELQQEMRYRQLANEERAAAVRADMEKKKQLILQRQKEIEQNALYQEERRRLKERERELERQVDAKNMQHELQLQEYIRRARAKLLEEAMPRLGNYAPIAHLREDERERYLPQLQAAQAFQEKEREKLRVAPKATTFL